MIRLPESPRARRRVLWGGGAAALLVVGLAAALLIPNRSQPSGTPSLNEGPAQMAASTHGRLKRADRRAIDSLLDRFIPAAVERKDMETAWNLAGPEMRAAATHAGFRRADIPVPIYPAHERNYHHWQAVDVEKDAVVLDILVHPTHPRTTGTQVFSVQVVKDRGRWLVNRIYTIAVMNPVDRPKTETHELGPADFAAPPSGGTTRGKPSKPTIIGKKGLIPALLVLLLIISIPIVLGIVALVRARRWKKIARANPRNTLPPLPSSYRKERDDAPKIGSRP